MGAMTLKDPLEPVEKMVVVLIAVSVLFGLIGIAFAVLWPT